MSNRRTKKGAGAGAGAAQMEAEEAAPVQVVEAAAADAGQQQDQTNPFLPIEVFAVRFSIGQISWHRCLREDLVFVAFFSNYFRRESKALCFGFVAFCVIFHPLFLN